MALGWPISTSLITPKPMYSRSSGWPGVAGGVSSLNGKAVRFAPIILLLGVFGSGIGDSAIANGVTVDGREFGGAVNASTGAENSAAGIGNAVPISGNCGPVPGNAIDGFNNGNRELGNVAFGAGIGILAHVYLANASIGFPFPNGFRKPCCKKSQLSRDLFLSRDPDIPVT